MKTTPIYILLLIFFLNFDLAWGLAPDKYHYYNFQLLYILNNESDLSSLEFNYILGNDQKYDNKTFVQKLHLNIGLNKVYSELGYDLGYQYKVFRNIIILPYLSSATNIYSLSLGSGIDFIYYYHGGLSFLANVNYKFNERLFGFTNSHQWYQKGLGFKIGINLEFPVFVRHGYCYPGD